MPVPFAHLFNDPPPAFAFELSETGIAYARRGAAEQHAFKAFESPALKVSPVHDNVQNAEAIKSAIDSIVPQDGKRRRAALILPDYCGRIAVLDFDSFPSAAEEQRSLVRFRMKKSVPFDVDSAIVAYHAQHRSGKGKIDVVVAIMAREIVTRYEAPFRSSALVPGDITTSSLAMLHCVQPDGLTLVAKLSGRTLSAMVLDGGTLKLFRCIEMETASREEIETVLHPTFVYVEDELKSTPRRLLLCGFGADSQDLAREWQSQWNVEVDLLRSRFGAPSQTDAGLLGYLESQS